MKEDLERLQKAISLDKQLPESKKSQNSHLKDIKKQYSSFFDEDSGTSLQESFEDLEDYLKQAIKQEKDK